MSSGIARACGLLVFSGILSVRASGQSEPTSVDVAPFRSVELRHGGKVILRYGPTQRVTFLKGSRDDARVTIASGDALVIEKVKSKGRPRRELEIEILTPELARVSIAHGGMIESTGSFPRQVAIEASVDNGGTIDIRSMAVGSVAASVLSGGRIFTKPITRIAATVVEGGNITYWGDARVTSSIERGGVIERGDPSDADRPVSEMGFSIAPVHTIPAPPPIKRL
ncbi:MAG TPA: hypothetical protein VJ650_09365 [Gemmatimonadaceae bacterium]|nr:hypothetical protein [Gemmatimonadaceae bacterium]